jgi:hypothetical protein
VSNQGSWKKAFQVLRESYKELRQARDECLATIRQANLRHLFIEVDKKILKTLCKGIEKLFIPYCEQISKAIEQEQMKERNNNTTVWPTVWRGKCNKCTLRWWHTDYTECPSCGTTDISQYLRSGKEIEVET